MTWCCECQAREGFYDGIAVEAADATLTFNLNRPGFPGGSIP
jgi:hypothetical protein